MEKQESKTVSEAVQKDKDKQAKDDKDKFKEVGNKDDIPIESQYITKAAAAIEVRKQAKLAFALGLSGVGCCFVSGIGCSTNLIIGSVLTGIGAVILGFFTIRAKQKVKYLEKTYKI